MTRVLLLCEYPTLLGGERSLLTVLPELQAAGFQFTALAPPDGPLAAAFAKRQVDVSPLAMRDASGERRPQESIRRQIAAAVASVRPNLLHANSLAMGRLSGPVAAELSLASIAHLRDIVGLSSQAVADLNRHGRLLAVSQAARDFHVAQGIAADKTCVAYNGVDLTRFHPRPPTGWLHARLRLPRDAVLVGAIGQLVLRKGHDVLASAAQTLAERWPRVHYVLAGSRFSEKAEAYEHEEGLHRAFNAGALAGRGHFLGHCDNIPELLPELTLLVHPSRQEPLGRVLLEAAAAGVPIVATDVGGTREVLRPGAAQLVAPDDAAALAAAIQRLLADENLRQQQAAAALSHVRARFDARTAAQTVAAHYREVIATGTTGART
ncbi:MAG: glycosyltransferase family 4 protein [Planctomycetia bacterium]|nr:glycosyltransferase family 4 protein [Planctomycetia bacterium]